MPSCTLNWYPDRGFELDLDVGDDDVTLRMVAIPVPAEGTAELIDVGVELNKLEVLFKGQAEIEGEPGQIQEARVRLIGAGLEVQVSIEDMETGEIVRWSTATPVKVSAEAPISGGPKPPTPKEDDLDWEDETTLERLIVDAPSASATPERRPDKELKTTAGIQRLLQALRELDEPPDSDDAEGDSAPGPSKRQTPASPGVRSGAGASTPPKSSPPRPMSKPPPVAVEPVLSAEEEGQRFLQFLLEREALQLEDDVDPTELAVGIVRLLQLPGGSESRARALSKWLMAQPQVADLFVDDDDLAALLDQW